MDSASEPLAGATVGVLLKRTNSDVPILFAPGDAKATSPDDAESYPESIVLEGTVSKVGSPVVLTATVVIPRTVSSTSSVELKAELFSVTAPKDSSGGTNSLLANGGVVTGTAAKTVNLYIRPTDPPPTVTAPAQRKAPPKKPN